jgi:hypothetical protein
VLRYLGSTVNVVACILALVALVFCVLTDAGLWLWPIVLGTYAVGAVLGWLLLPRRGGGAGPGRPVPRRAAR